METFWQFTGTDNSIDAVGVLFFLLAGFHSLRYLYINNISIQGKILYVFIAVISLLHVFQTASQLYFGGPVWYTFRMWDIINYLTGAFMFMIVRRIYNKERYN